MSISIKKYHKNNFRHTEIKMNLFQMKRIVDIKNTDKFLRKELKIHVPNVFLLNNY